MRMRKTSTKIFIERKIASRLPLMLMLKCCDYSNFFEWCDSKKTV